LDTAVKERFVAAREKGRAFSARLLHGKEATGLALGWLSLTFVLQLHAWIREQSMEDSAKGGVVSIPVVAIVGRPNVGKSSLFNWLAGRRIAIVDPTAGVTRDRVSTLLKLGDRFVELCDTGGMGIEDSDNLTPDIERQIQTAIDQAHVVLHVVDGRAGLVPLDEEVAARLRYVTKPVVCVANKCDTPEIDANTAEFYKLGRGKLVCVSAQQNRGRDELLKILQERLPAPEELETPADVAMKLAIVGRRNTGKSTFINSLAQSERMIVSEVPGTTRDSVDVRFERDGKVFVAIDTAGVRKKKSLANDIEFYSLARAERSVRRADVVLLFFDAQQRISRVDKQLAEYILDQHKPAIFVVNKWDLMLPRPTGKMGDYIRATFPSLAHVPIAFITAKAGKNVQQVLNLAQALHKQAGARVSTGDLNRVLREAMERNPPPLRQNRRAKVYYATQVAANPPTIVLFTNGPELFDNTYLRYLLKTFRDQLPFAEVAIKLHLRAKRREDAEAEEPPPEAKPPRKKRTGTDAGLPFRTRLEANEQPGKGSPYESELWRDV
jgi:GTP-binding protein